MVNPYEGGAENIKPNDIGLFSAGNIAENKKNTYEYLRRTLAKHVKVKEDMVRQGPDGKWYYGNGTKYDVPLESLEDLDNDKDTPWYNK